MTTPPDRLAPETFRAITQARLTLGLRGRALDTGRALGFALDHARAREAVLSELDVPGLTRGLTEAGLETAEVTSAAETRDTFIRRPDLGRRLAPGAAERLLPAGPVDVALVLGDGLSALAVARHGVAFLRALREGLAVHGVTTGPVVLARQARVALGDEIAAAMQARTVVMALGERPGLSAADSLGVYVTHDPAPGIPDSARNCISNVRDEGLPVAQAARQTELLIVEMRRTGLSGVALSKARAAGALT